MAFSVVLTDGVTDVDLYYSAAAGISLLDEGLKPGRPEDRSLYGGLAQDILIRSLKGRRQVPLELHVEGSSDDDLLNRINQLEHLVRKAEDFAILGYGDEVFLEFKLSAATYTSRFPILGCDLDVDRLMSVFVKDIQVVDRVPFVLTCKPYWESKTLFSLNNYLKTPHFEEDTNSDGRADNWSSVGVTTALDTTIYLIGKQSQKVVTDEAGDDSIYSDNVTETETSGVAYAWVYVASGDEVAVELWDATTTTLKDTALYSAADWATKVGADGNTWKRLVVSSDSLASGNLHGLRIIRRTGDATQVTTFYVDQCYFEFGRTDTPVGWMSFRDIENHDDTDVGDISYVDFADIPGDVDAIIKLKVKNTSGANQDILHVFMDDEINRYQSHYEAEDLPYGSPGTAEAGNSNGKYTTVNVSQEGPTASNPLGRIDLAASTAEELRGEFRLLGRARDENLWPIEGRFRFRVNAFESSTITLEYGEWRIGSDQELMDFGSFKIQPDWLRGLSPCRLSILIEGQRRPGEAAFDQYMDYFFLAPLYQSVVIRNVQTAWVVAANEHFMIDSESGVCYLVSADETYVEFTFSYTGNIITLPPRKPLRIYFLQGDNDQDYEIDASMRVTVEFRARGIHLMGTE